MKDNEIFMSKGDDVAFSISLTGVDGKPYTLQAGDKIIFSVSCGLKIETGGVRGRTKWPQFTGGEARCQ